MPGLRTKPDIEGGVSWSQLICVDLSLLKVFFFYCYLSNRVSALCGAEEKHKQSGVEVKMELLHKISHL